MYLKPRKPSTDPRLRSLLQKAVRRGSVPIVERVGARLDSIGDSTWLRSRTVVITFEECWPLAGSLLSVDRALSSKIGALTGIARSAKQKDAAGLGALAHAHREGDSSVLALVPDRRALRIVAEALGRPDEFFRWALSDVESKDGTDIIRAAQRYLTVATWDWDKACILAGALLATTGPVPNPTPISLAQTAEGFPYWTALDKHTDEGKVVLRDVAKSMKVKYRQLIWASFYCESARVNELLPSPWFAAERTWRLARAKLTYEAGQELWSRASVLVRDRLASDAETLKRLVESELPTRVAPQHTMRLG